MRRGSSVHMLGRIGRTFLVLVLACALAPFAGAEAAAGGKGTAAGEASRALELDGGIYVKAAHPAGSDASGHFYATVSSNMESYASGSTAMFTVDYTIDPGSISAGDTVTVSVPADMYAAGCRLSVNSQHFSDVVDNGDGTYTLVFAQGAETALAGSFSLFATTGEEGTKTVTVGNASASITVNAKGDGSDGGGVVGGSLGYNTNKDSFETEGVSWSGYDYSNDYGNGAAQVGVYDSGEDRVITYRIYVNGNLETVDNVVVTDVLPDGMSYVNTQDIVLQYCAYNETYETLVKGMDYEIAFADNSMSVTFLHAFNKAVQIKYYAKADAGNGVRYVNHVKYVYERDGKTFEENRDNILVGSGNSAANGTKQASKAVVTADGSQFVRYTITFWTAQGGGFATGSINLTDELNPFVRFLYADPSDVFAIDSVRKTNASGQEYDSVSIANTAPIPQHTSMVASFVVDFSGVPVGSSVRNTSGNNVVTTIKEGTLFQGLKTTEGIALEGGDFSFAAQQVDGLGATAATDGGLSCTATNAADGTIEFGSLVFDAAGEHWFRIYELEGDDTAICYDDTSYWARVVVKSYDQTVGAVTAVSNVVEDVVYYNADGDEIVNADGTDVVFTNTHLPEGPKTPKDEDVPPGKVNVIKSVDKDTAGEGDTVTYTLKATNIGDSVAKGIYVKDFVPDYTSYIACGGAGEGTYGATIEGKEFATWYIDELAPDEAVDLTLTVRVNECNDSSKIKNIALYTVDEPERPNSSFTPDTPTNEVVVEDATPAGKASPAEAVGPASEDAAATGCAVAVETGDWGMSTVVYAFMFMLGAGFALLGAWRMLVGRRKSR